MADVAELRDKLDGARLLALDEIDKDVKRNARIHARERAEEAENGGYYPEEFDDRFPADTGANDVVAIEMLYVGISALLSIADSLDDIAFELGEQS